jgi:hypothetical protein
VTLRLHDNAAPAKRTADDWFTPWQFAGLLGLLIIACFPQVVAGFETFAYLDAGQFGYPVAFYRRECFWHGEMPLWNPLNSCGIPFLAQWNTMALYPFSLFYLLLPLSWSYGVFCLAHLFLAGLGMYFLAFRWTGHRLAAAVAGAAYAFNGLAWYGLMWANLTAGLSWMPWVVLAAERAWHCGGRAVILAALAGAMQMLTGGAEAIAQTWLLLGVLWLAHFVQGRSDRVRIAGRALAVGCLTAGLAAAQLLPFLDLLAHSQRNTDYARVGMEGIAALPLTGWVNYLVPRFCCLPSPQGVFHQAGQAWTGSYYLGVGTVTLALLAVWRARSRQVWLLAGLGVFSLAMALGSRGLVYDWVSRLVPLVGFIRFPAKFVMLATFVIPLLAAFGLAWLLTASVERWPGEWVKTKGLAAGLLALMALIVWFAWKHPLLKTDAAATAWNALVRGVFLVLVVGCIGFLRRESDWKLQRFLQTGLIILLWLDVFTHSSSLSPTVARSVLEPDAIRQNFQWGNQLKPGVSRAMQSKDSFWRLLSTESANPEQDVGVRRLTLFLDCNLLDHASKIDGFYPLDLKEFLDIFKHVYFTTNQAERLKDFLGVSYISNPTNAVDWVHRDSFLPMITAGQKPVFADKAETLNSVLGDGFEPLRLVYLPLEAQGQLQATSAANARIVSSQFTHHWLGIEVEAGAPAMVVVAQAFYHPWHAYVDGKPTPLWRANHAFQALEVPAGKHQVRLAYEDRNFLYGSIISLTSLLGCGVTWVWYAKRRTSGTW